MRPRLVFSYAEVLAAEVPVILECGPRIVAADGFTPAIESTVPTGAAAVDSARRAYHAAVFEHALRVALRAGGRAFPTPR